MRSIPSLWGPLGDVISDDFFTFTSFVILGWASQICTSCVGEKELFSAANHDVRWRSLRSEQLQPVCTGDSNISNLANLGTHTNDINIGSVAP